MRQDTKMATEARDFAAASGSPAAGASSGGRLSVRGLGHSYDALETIARLDLDVAAGGVLGVVGPSGCGKSTLLELVCGLREPARGTIEVDGAAAAGERLARCAFMPQRDLLFPWLSALDNAALALRNAGLGRAEARRRSAEPFARLGLGGFERAKPNELSGGMRQRVAFLRTLVSGKPVLALDEPFASLDAITRAETQRWLAGALEADPRTVVLVTHDVEEALYLSDRVAVLSARPARDRRGTGRPRRRARPTATSAVTDPEFVAAARAGDARPARRDDGMRRWPLPALAPGGADRLLAARREQRRARRRPEPRTVPRPLAGRNRSNRSGRTARCWPKTPG